MMNKKLLLRRPWRLFAAACLVVALAACSKHEAPPPDDGGGGDGGDDYPYETAAPVRGSRIGWDYSTRERLCPLPGRGIQYSSYPRVKLLSDGTLACIYEVNQGIEFIRQNADGVWRSPVVLASPTYGMSYCVPELLELSDGTLLGMYNPRPTIEDVTRKFAIHTMRSVDGGVTWTDHRVVYEASHKGIDGCWEPAAIELPDGEIQLYFANEAPYTASGEQEISMCSSRDGGLSWSAARAISFAPKARDGMPVPVYDAERGEILVAIEDNSAGKFRPSIVRTTYPALNWSNAPVGKPDAYRNSALAYSIATSAAAAAPYLVKLPTGEYALSYQTEEGRSQPTMEVAIGTVDGRSFTRRSVPFSIAGDKSALWNALEVTGPREVAAVSSTTGYSNVQEVWMVRGRIMPEYEAAQASVTVDGKLDEQAWQDALAFFAGSKTVNRVYAGLCHDADNLYVGARLLTSGHTGTYTVRLGLDPLGRSATRPTPGIYRITVTTRGAVSVEEGTGTRWAVTGTKGVTANVVETPDGYTMEVALPLASLGVEGADAGLRRGFNLEWAGNGFSEMITSNTATMPYTWCSFFMK